MRSGDPSRIQRPAIIDSRFIFPSELKAAEAGSGNRKPMFTRTNAICEEEKRVRGLETFASVVVKPRYLNSSIR